MWLLAVAILILIVFLAISLGFVPPPHATTLIRIREGTVSVQKGQLRADAREHVTDILQSAGVRSGYIAITPGDRVAFSRQIPPSLRQRLRNVVLNQWA